MLEWFNWDTWLAMGVLVFGVLFLHLRDRYNFMRQHNQMRWLVVIALWMAGGHLVLRFTEAWWDGLMIGLMLATFFLSLGEVRHGLGNWWRRMTGRRARK